jgi:predicted RecB family nuclease
MPEHLGIVLGSGSQERLRTSDYFSYYKAIKRAFLEQQHTFDPDRLPRLSGTADYRHWGGHVTRLLEQRDDLSFVANIRASQIDKLQSTGIATLTQLATLREDVPTIQTGTLNRLRMQARSQLESRSLPVPRLDLS